MPDSEAKPPYALELGDKVSSVLIYTQNQLIWGDVITKEGIRVSTWLRTVSVPRYIFIHDAHAIPFGGGSALKPQSYAELHLPTSQVMAFHLKPPAQDSVDYDPKEPNRIMTPVTALVGAFHFDGLIRMSMQTTLQRYLDVSKEVFSGMYEIEISQPNMPSMGIIRVPFALLRADAVSYSPRNV